MTARPYKNRTLARANDAILAADDLEMRKAGLSQAQRAEADTLAREMLAESPWIGWAAAQMNALAVVERSAA